MDMFLSNDQLLLTTRSCYTLSSSTRFFNRCKRSPHCLPIVSIHVLAVWSDVGSNTYRFSRPFVCTCTNPAWASRWSCFTIPCLLIGNSRASCVAVLGLLCASRVNSRRRVASARAVNTRSSLSIMAPCLYVGDEFTQLFFPPLRVVLETGLTHPVWQRLEPLLRHGDARPFRHRFQSKDHQGLRRMGRRDSPTAKRSKRIGSNHFAMCSGVVIACHTRSRSAVTTMLRSIITASMNSSFQVQPISYTILPHIPSLCNQSVAECRAI